MFVVLNKEKIRAYTILLSTVAILFMVSTTLPRTNKNNTVAASSIAYEDAINEIEKQNSEKN